MWVLDANGQYAWDDGSGNLSATDNYGNTYEESNATSPNPSGSSGSGTSSSSSDGSWEQDSKGQWVYKMPDGSTSATDPYGNTYEEANPGTSNSGTYTSSTTNGPAAGVQYSASSPSGYVDASGKPINKDGSAYTSNTAPNNAVTSLLKSLGIPASALTSGNVAAVAGLGTILNQLTGGNKVQTNNYQGSIPVLNAVRSQIDPANQGIANGYGQKYFTDTNYVAPGGTDSAQSQADAQAKTIADAQQNAATNIKSQELTSHPTIATNWIKSGEPVKASTAATTPGAGLSWTPASISAIQNQVQQMQANPGLYSGIATKPINQDDNQQQGGDGGDSGGNAHGGIIGAATGGIMPTGIANMAHGRYLAGPTDGMADKINTSIDGTQPAKLSHGEFVIPADVVSHLGNGNSDAGAKKLYQMMDKIRLARTGNKKQGKEINPDHFMPGGIAGYAKGGGIKGFDGTTGSTVTSVPAQGTTTNTGLTNTFGPTATNMIAKSVALANTPTPVYQGQIVAGPTEDQTQYFQNAATLAQTGVSPTQFQTQQWDTNAANQYMNPYIQNALDPQLAALQRQNAINTQGDMSKLTQAGAFGGSRQAVLQGQDQYNLLAQQAGLIGQGYNTAYNNAQNSFNTANQTGLQAQQDQEAANEASANYAMNANSALGGAGATQRQIQQDQDTAALNQFNQQAQDPYQKQQFLQSMLTGMPVTSTSTTNNTSGASDAAALMNQFLSYYNTIMSPGGSSGGGSSGTSSGTTPSTSAGTTKV